MSRSEKADLSVVTKFNLRDGTKNPETCFDFLTNVKRFLTIEDGKLIWKFPHTKYKKLTFDSLHRQ